MHSTLIFTLLVSAVSAQLSTSNLEKHVGSLALSSAFGPVKESYWTEYPHHRRTPFAVSPDGKSAYLAYLDASETGVHIQQVNPSTFAAVGAAVTVAGGKEAGGLVAHNDGFALLTNEAMPSGTSNAPPASTPVPVLYRYTSGKQTFKTWLGGPDNAGGMGMLASPDLNGDLAYSEASGMYGAYFVVTAYSGSAQGHFGDAIQYVNNKGKLEQIQGASSSWGCSHNTGIAFEGADSVPFPSICSEDQGAIWLNTGGTGMDNSGVKISNENVTNGAGNEAMGGMSGSYSGLARFQGSDSYIFSWVSRGAKDLTVNDWMGAGYTHSVNRTVNRNVAIATMSDKKTLVGKQATSELVADGDSQINWITTGSADCSNAHVATFDKSNALVTWEEIAEPTCDFLAMGCRGAYTGSYFQLVADGKKVGAPVKATDVYVSGDMVTMADGRICWPYVDMKWTLDGPVRNAASVKKMSFACMRNGAGTTPKQPEPAAPASSAPAAAAAPSSAIAEKVSSVIEIAQSTGAPIEIETPVASASAAPEAPADPALPTFEIVTSGATITPPSTTIPATALPTIVYSVEYSASIPTEISSLIPTFTEDQPAPSATVTLPASESFNPTDAPAFTESTDIPNPTIGPESSSTPCSEGLEATATGAEGEAPTVTPLPTEAGKPSEGRPSPTGDWYHGGRPGFGWGRPRPSGWGPRPGRGGSFGPRPSAGTQPEKYDFGMAKASSTPCTLETRVKPTATGAAY